MDSTYQTLWDRLREQDILATEIKPPISKTPSANSPCCQEEKQGDSDSLPPGVEDDMEYLYVAYAIVKEGLPEELLRPAYTAIGKRFVEMVDKVLCG